MSSQLTSERVEIREKSATASLIKTDTLSQPVQRRAGGKQKLDFPPTPQYLTHYRQEDSIKCILLTFPETGARYGVMRQKLTSQAHGRIQTILK